ncbi:MAG: hypothetical protein FJ040_03910 [Chloroflexi bacterium]|nr:hypothetical protein [Chloroflexota bacterium]
MHGASIDYYEVGLQRIVRLGGIQQLPEVLTMTDVAMHCEVPVTWLMQLWSADALPGTSFVGAHSWRCRRETFLEWLKEHADEQRYRMAWTQRSDPPHSSTPHTYQRGRGRQTLSH